ncbi:hypothetical protein [Nonomuraea sp. NPDC049625]|uniref:hypothetical protein n=1 Tax=Nonomuraea sp. NPDC049625 TaxID=3155775 RepID=UPI0034136ED1
MRWGRRVPRGYGTAALQAGTETPRDEEVWERLAGAGVEPWPAEQLLTFLPMAYTRRLLADASYPDGLVTPSGRASLLAGPVFVAALGRAAGGRASWPSRCPQRRRAARSGRASLSAGPSVRGGVGPRAVGQP